MDAAGKMSGLITGLIVLVAVPFMIGIGTLLIRKETEIMEVREAFVKQVTDEGIIKAEDYLFVSSVQDYEKTGFGICLIKPAQRLGNTASGYYFTKTKKEIENELERGDIRIPKGAVIYVGR